MTMNDSRPTASQPGSATARAPADGGRPETAAARARRVSDGASAPVLPDCCNLGILLRILVPLNLAAALLGAALATSWADLGRRLLEIGAVLEPVALVSLVALCGTRKAVNGMPRRVQWMVGLAVPVLLTLVVCLLTGRLLVPDLAPAAFASWIAARCLIALALAALTIEFFRLRALSFSPSLAEARLQALQARIRPHFLFNSLNTVLGLMRADPRRAENTLENLADLFRVFMRDTRELVPLDEEVVTCKQYLAIEQLRLGERLCVTWVLDQMPGDALLPGLLLQPLVENAVHHGIEPRSEPGEIRIVISRPGERVRVEILNPAEEQQPMRRGNQMALSNIRERLMLLYDMEAELKTTEEDGQFRLLLELPYRKERRRRDDRRHFDPDR
jgi:two-component system sensor histidine kinase AlgZ